MSRTRGLPAGSVAMPSDDERNAARRPETGGPKTDRDEAISLMLATMNELCRRLDAMEALVYAAQRANAESVTSQTFVKPTVH